MELFLGIRIVVVDDVRLCVDLKGFFLVSGGILDWFFINFRKIVIVRCM